MEAFVIVVTLMGEPNLHAFGPFQNENGCWRWEQMVNQGPPRTWMSRCMKMDEFRRRYPNVTLDEGST